MLRHFVTIDCICEQRCYFLSVNIFNARKANKFVPHPDRVSIMSPDLKRAIHEAEKCLPLYAPP